MSGMWQSVITRSNGHACQASRALRPSVQACTCSPRPRRRCSSRCRLVGWSSATSPQAGGSAGTAAAGGGDASAGRSQAARSSSIHTVVPSPGLLRSCSSAPIDAASSRQIARPRPLPPKRRVDDGSAWV
ncbi:hypothetical protein G6F46_014978 [Rhizopus delemar]|nr:hypothetical protein G6F46_014978 [Rhizopus delemar]